ncbi:uncharacterized protein CIMG_13719 [Coccidioides immitis RS]|uniref:Uncharacterized protein n=1 Tax=Coccidioides immitis (strain RS) TaxID=246410 RepID=J3KBK6_COCIM|nr:uncharacterized protein CIMG_13719 [Coccidioides immitis RS]EAS32514.3 hypothetical protein CIMG_13719 [Coccidioides immitis RS]
MTNEVAFSKIYSSLYASSTSDLACLLKIYTSVSAVVEFQVAGTVRVAAEFLWDKSSCKMCQLYCRPTVIFQSSRPVIDSKGCKIANPSKIQAFTLVHSQWQSDSQNVGDTEHASAKKNSLHLPMSLITQHIKDSRSIIQFKYKYPN